MATAVTETETYPATVQGPSAGDPRTSASVRTMGSGGASRTKWIWARLQALLGTFAPIGSAPVAVSAVDTSADTLTLTGHGFSSNDPVRVVLATGAAVPSGLSTTTVYYAIVADADTVQLSTSSGPGAAVNITGTGSGGIYLAKVTDALSAILVPAAGGLPAGTVRSLFSLFLDVFTLGSTTSTSSGSRLVGVEAITGTSFSITAGTLYAVLASIANGVAWLAASGNHFLGTVTVDGAATLSNTLDVSGVTTVSAINVSTDLRLKDGAVLTRDGTAISSGSLTASVDPAAHGFYRANAWNGTSGLLDITLEAYGGALQAPEVEIEFNPVQPSAVATFSLPASSSPLVVLTGRGTVRFRWVGGVAECITPKSESLVFCD